MKNTTHAILLRQGYGGFTGRSQPVVFSSTRKETVVERNMLVMVSEREDRWVGPFRYQETITVGERQRHVVFPMLGVPIAVTWSKMRLLNLEEHDRLSGISSRVPGR